MSRELNKREGIKYWLFSGRGGWGFLYMNLHTINYTLDRAPWPSSVFLTSLVDASKILAFVSPFFADLWVLLFVCVIMGISGRNQEELQAPGHLEPGWNLCLSDEQEDGFGNSQMLPEIASLKGKTMSGLLFLATGLFSRWEDRLPLKLQGSGSSTWGDVPQREPIFLRQVQSSFGGLTPSGSWVLSRHPRSWLSGSPSVWNQASALWK